MKASRDRGKKLAQVEFRNDGVVPSTAVSREMWFFHSVLKSCAFHPESIGGPIGAADHPVRNFERLQYMLAFSFFKRRGLTCRADQCGRWFLLLVQLCERRLSRS